MNEHWMVPSKVSSSNFMWIRFQDGHQRSRKINIGPYGKMNNYFFFSEATSLFKPKLYNKFYVNQSEIQDDNFCRILKFNIIGKNAYMFISQKMQTLLNLGCMWRIIGLIDWLLLNVQRAVFQLYLGREQGQWFIELGKGWKM